MSTATAPLPSSVGLRFNSCIGVASLARERPRFANLQVIALREDGLANEDIYVASREARQLNFGHYET